MELFFLHAGLLAAVFVAHALFLKRRFTSEKSIFLFHVCLFLLLPLFTAGIYSCVYGHVTQLDLLLAYGMSGVYSLSFLELWSLTEGSYSLQLLNAIHSGTPEQVQALGVAVGEQKQTNRLQGVVRLKLVKKSGDLFRIAPAGWIVAMVTLMIVTASGAKMRE